jgi:hypothetical protein
MAVIVATPGLPALNVVVAPERGNSVPLDADQVGKTPIALS